MHHHLVLFAFDWSKLQYNFPIENLFDKNYMLGLSYTQFNILWFAKVELYIVWIVWYLLVWNLICVCLFKYFISGFLIIFDKPQNYLFKNTILKFYIKVSIKPLCIMCLFPYEKLFYFKT